MNRAQYTGWPSSNFPLSTEGLDFIQSQVMMAAAFAKSAGGNYILSGCTVTGTTASAGIMVLNGEIITFVGGTIQTTVRIKETATDITAGSVTYTGAYKTRVAEFGSNVGGVDTFTWADITAFPTAFYLAANKADKTDVEALRNLVMPKGGIIMWSGAIADIPTGWALCNGATVSGVATPNLSGRFIVGYDAASANIPANSTDTTENYGKVGNTGGKGSVTLKKAEQGSFDVKAVSDRSEGSSRNNTAFAFQFKASSDANFTALGNNPSGGNVPLGPITVNIGDASTAHENRPPYYVLAYIMKVV
jgi:microcystin-dependent protein